MKYSVGLVVAAGLLVISVSGDLMQTMQIEGARCLTETNADLVKLIKTMQGEDVEVDKNMKCFGACLMKSFGVMSADGVISKEAAVSHVPADISHRDEILKAIDNCFHGEGSDHCETAWAVGVCLKKNHLGLAEVFM